MEDNMPIKGTTIISDGWQLSVFLLEYFKLLQNMTGKEAYDFLKKHEVFDFLISREEWLKLYVLEDIYNEVIDFLNKKGVESSR